MTEPRDLTLIMEPCYKRRNGPGEWICDRCGSLWTDMLAGTGWLPLSCVDRRDGHGEIASRQETKP